jgi:hypothetical protein
MSLTLTEKFTVSLGGKKMKLIQVTHDEATSTFTAASVDMTYFEALLPGTPYLSSTPADTSTLINHMIVSIIADGTQIEFLEPPNAASKTNLLIIGW